MKKIIIAIVAFFYLVISSGFTVHMHYCMNKLAGWGLFHSDKDKCGICGMHKGDTKGCCKDEHKAVRFINDQKVTDNSFVNTPPLAQALHIYIVSGYSIIDLQPEYYEFHDLPPPYLLSIPVFIRNCNFRI
jgi:hypothetical protein